MAEKNKLAGTAENTATRAAKKFTTKKLQANCRELFGVSSCTFAGATYGMTGEYSVDEMKAHIEKWCSKEVR